MTMGLRPSLLVAVLCTILSAGPSLAVLCPPLYSELGGRCLLFLPNLAQTWPQASAFCSNTNGSLAIVDDCALLGQIARHIDFDADLTPEQGYWIGGTDEHHEGNFTWEDGSDVPRHMPFWGTYYIQGDVYPEPNGDEAQNCLGILSSDRYYFHDVECDRQMAVLCEAPDMNVTKSISCSAKTDGVNEARTTTIETTDISSETSVGTSPTTTIETTDVSSETSGGTSPTTTIETTDVSSETSGRTSPTTTIETTDVSVETSGETSDANSSEETTMEPDTTPSTAPCPPDYELVGVACFQFFQDTPVSWPAAARLCTSNGGTLATLDDCDMLADVAAYINENGLRPGSLGYWIGATDEASEGVFRWTADDSLVPLRMPFWGRNELGPEPNGLDIENCAMLAADDRYFFHDTMCSNERAVLCRAPVLVGVKPSRKSDC